MEFAKVAELAPPDDGVHRDSAGVERHRRDGRPKIYPEGGGKGEYYTRVSTLVDMLNDKSTLNDWKLRQVLKGLGRRPDLMEDYLKIGDPDGHDKWKALKVAERAMDAADAGFRASAGTEVHNALEAHLKGQQWTLPPDIAPDVTAFSKAFERLGLEFLDSEVFSVHDSLKAAGSCDYILTRPGGSGDPQVILGDTKGFPLTTPIPTPTGWTTMGSVQVGDSVIGADGKPCVVTRKSEIKDLDCYRVTFDDATSIVCDEEHLWETTIRKSSGAKEVAVRDVLEIRDTLTSPAGQKWHSVRMAGPVDLPEAELFTDPYVLGVWLGDGRARGGDFTKGVADGAIADEIRSRGYEVSKWADNPKRPTVSTWNVVGLRGELMTQDLICNKHVPSAYLRGSVSQRLDLLRGLMDTDGTYNTARGQVSFSSCDEALAQSVYELAVSLGERAVRDTRDAHGFGLTVAAHTVKWVPRNFNPFNLPRKRDQVTLRDTGRNSRRLITSVEKVERVPTQCIGVSSGDHMYLVGEQMVPTHNTGAAYYGKTAMQIGVYANSLRYNPITHERSDLTDGIIEVDVDRTEGLFIHVPLGAGTCEIKTLDLTVGYEDACLAAQVREARRRHARKSAIPDTLVHVSADGVDIVA